MIARAFGLAALLAVASAGLAVPSLANHDPRPFRLEVSSHGLTARATLGTFCRSTSNHDGTGSTLCDDAAYPLDTRGRVPVHRGGRVHLELNYAARRVSVAPVHFSRDGERFHFGRPARVRRKDGDARRFVARLPNRLERRTRALDVFVRYRNGDDADFWAGLNVHPRHRD